MHPEVHFDYLEPRQWVGKSFKELHEEMNKLRKSVKEAIGYIYDNSHFRIDDIYGRPALFVSFYANDVSFWNARNGCGIGSFSKVTGKEDLLAAITGSDIMARGTHFTEEMAKLIEKWCEQVEKGLTMCNKCHEWHEGYISYSYAGAVCLGCYDPNRHLPPDTRGD